MAQDGAAASLGDREDSMTPGSAMVQLKDHMKKSALEMSRLLGQKHTDGQRVLCIKPYQSQVLIIKTHKTHKTL